MKYVIPLTGVALAAMTVAVGVVHGNLTSRWGAKPDVAAGAKRLELVPQQFGEWRQLNEEKLAPDASRMLQCQGSLLRTYENKKGDLVSIAVLLGPAGPISVHTPEVCYSARDFQINGERKAFSLGEGDHAFWDLKMTSNDVARKPLRVMYAWANDKTWQAPQQPRFAYGGSPYLYKIQLAGPPMNSEQGDACRDFLIAFLPVLNKHLIDK
jgi:hypothetical protein